MLFESGTCPWKGCGAKISAGSWICDKHGNGLNASQLQTLRAANADFDAGLINSDKLTSIRKDILAEAQKPRKARKQ